MANLISTPGTREDASLDPEAGGTYRGKVIYDVTQVDENLNRTGYSWYLNNYGELDDGVLNYGFWRNYEELANSYYVNANNTTSFNEAFFADDFSIFNAGQQTLARESIGLWDDLIAIKFQETKSYEADIAMGNTYTGGAQAYAYLPFGDIYDASYKAEYNFEEIGKLSGDVWIDGFVASNFNPLTSSYYAKTTMIHELGHSLGLSHPGDYNATDDDDGDGVADPITYENDAFFAQDSRQYSIMSYFDAYETGAQHIDFSLLNFAYSSTPMVHDVSAIQAIYGADTTTRTGNTVYGFNSTADRSEFDFTVNTRPIVTIWDAGGRDTLDFSGFKTPTILNLNAGAFSSAGGVLDFPTLEQVNANRAAIGFAPRSQAQYDFYEGLKAELGITNGLYKDNISIAYGATIENAIGGTGNDLIIANEARNAISGRNGNDTVSYETATSAVQLKLGSDAVPGTGGAAGDVLRFIENLTGSKFNDTLVGDVSANILNGGEGNDILRGLGGTDTFVFLTSGQSGRDQVRDFTRADLIATDKEIAVDQNGMIMPVNNVIILDASDGDQVKLDGVTTGLRLISEMDGLFYYGLANTTVSAKAIDALAKPNFGRDPINTQHVSNIADPESSLFTDVSESTHQGRDANYVNPYGIEQAVHFEDHDHDHDDGVLSMGGGNSFAAAPAAAAFGGDHAAPLAAMTAFGGINFNALMLGMVHEL